MVDGTFINSIINTNLLIVGTPDVNHHIIPLGFAFCQGEKCDIIQTLIEKSVNHKFSNIKTIFSDEGVSIEQAIANLGLSDKHKNCLFHLATRQTFFKLSHYIFSIFKSVHNDEFCSHIKHLKSLIKKNYPNVSKEYRDNYLLKLMKINPFKTKDFDAGLFSTSILESFNNEIKKWSTRSIPDLISELIEYAKFFKEMQKLKM